jgi:hypothetical protein
MKFNERTETEIAEYRDNFMKWASAYWGLTQAQYNNWKKSGLKESLLNLIKRMESEQ